MIKAVGGASPRTYSYNDVKSEAFRMLREEINTMVSKPLSPQEEEKLQQVADAVTKQVLSELHSEGNPRFKLRYILLIYQVMSK